MTGVAVGQPLLAAGVTAEHVVSEATHTPFGHLTCVPGQPVFEFGHVVMSVAHKPLAQRTRRLLVPRIFGHELPSSQLLHGHDVGDRQVPSPQRISCELTHGSTSGH